PAEEAGHEHRMHRGTSFLTGPAGPRRSCRIPVAPIVTRAHDPVEWRPRSRVHLETVMGRQGPACVRSRVGQHDAACGRGPWDTAHAAGTGRPTAESGRSV